MFLLVLAHPGSPGQRAKKWLLLLSFTAKWELSVLRGLLLNLSVPGTVDVRQQNWPEHSTSRLMFTDIIPTPLNQSAELQIVIIIYLLQSPAIAIAIARDCYILVVFLFIFFSVHQIFDIPGPIFAKLYHTTWYVLK